MLRLFLMLSLCSFVPSVFANNPPIANEYHRGKTLLEAGRLEEAQEVWQSLLQGRRSELNETQVKALQGRLKQVASLLDKPLVRARNAYWLGRKQGDDGGLEHYALAEREALRVLRTDKKNSEAAFLAAASILRQGNLTNERKIMAYKLGRKAVETKPGRTDELLDLFPKGELWDELDSHARNIRIEKRQQTLWGEGNGGEETDRLLKENVAGVKFGGRIFKKKAYKRNNYRR